MDNGMSQEEAEKLAATPPAARTATAAPRPLQIDLTKVTVPVLAINGELDRPHYKTTRLAPEFFNSPTVVRAEKAPLPAIVAGPMPPLYVESLVGFVNPHDRQ